MSGSPKQLHPKVMEACVTALCSAESGSLHDKVKAVIDAYEDYRRIERLTKKARKQ